MKYYCSVIIESRPLPSLKEIIWDNHLMYIPEDWDLYFIGSEQNYELAKSLPAPKKGISIVNSLSFDFENNFNRRPDFGIKEYNELLTSARFWQQFLEYDRVLIFQHDSKILREGIMEFATADYDMIGAAWKWPPYSCNGGFRLSNPRAMYKVCQDFKYEWPKDSNEDCWFSKIMHENPQYGKVAPVEECMKFSVETIFGLGSLGLHAINKWLSKEECELIESQYNTK